MQTRMTVEDPAKVKVTLKVTMAAEEWEQLRDALAGGSYPIWTPMHHLTSAINDLLGQMRKILYPAEPADAPK